jgi:hypothetical protein
MPAQGLVLDINDMKEAVADWAEKTTGKRPDLDKIAHAGWGQGEWCFQTSPWRPSGAPTEGE